MVVSSKHKTVQRLIMLQTLLNVRLTRLESAMFSLQHKMHIPEACRYAARIAALQVEGNYITINQLGLD